jgi:SNF2 family DNA or RNA helicase
MGVVDRVIATLPEAARLSRDKRRQAAARVRQLHDIDPWPKLDWFNSDPCPRHAPDLDILCRQCGIEPRNHQRVGASWMYLGLPGMLTDTYGSGKTAQALLLLAMCKQTGELGPHNRAVVVTKAAGVYDPWANELKRLTPGLQVFVADAKSRDARIRGYLGNWEVVVISDRTLGGAHGRKTQREGDVEYLTQFPVGILIYDDVDPMRNNETETSVAVNRLVAQCTRVHGLHATPLQKRLAELWCMLQPVGGREALGSLEYVKSRYVRTERRVIVTNDPKDKTGRKKIRRVVHAENGVTSNPRVLAEFRAKVAPLVLRRTAADFDDVKLPQIQYDPVLLDLSPRQRKRYDELSRGALRRLRADGGVEITVTEAGVAFMRGRQVCSGLASIDAGPAADDSAKLDWVMNALTGDLCDEKAVVFVGFKANVAALSARLDAEGIGHVLIWSNETDGRERARRLERFRTDPGCRVLVGTIAIQTSLNLQVARHVIAVDTILNVQGMEQLIGRVRRVGSPYPTVWLHHLMARDTLEEAFLPMLRREGEMSDAVWDEEQSTFAGWSPRQMMRLVAHGRIAPVEGELLAS